MNNTILQLCAWHESGRVVFAYLSGFSCDSLELSSTDYGHGKAALNGGQDTALIQQILSGNSAPIAGESRKKAIETAQHLMGIYCAGSCARALFEQASNQGGELEVDVPAQDDKQIQAIQKFLLGANPEQGSDLASKNMARVMQKLKEPEIWKAVSSLANAAIKKEEKPLKRFEIEDALMAAGMKIRKPASSGFSVGLTDNDKKSKKEEPAEEHKNPVFGHEATADILLNDFFRKIRKDWTDTETQEAVKYVKGVIAKYGAA